MKRTGGRANPQRVNVLLRKALGEGPSTRAAARRPSEV